MRIRHLYFAIFVLAIILLNTALSENVGDLTKVKFGNSCFLVNVTADSDPEDYEINSEEIDSPNYPLLNCTNIDRDFFMTQKRTLLQIKTLLLTNSALVFEDLSTFLPNITTLELRGSLFNKTSQTLPSVAKLIITATSLPSIPAYLLTPFPVLQQLVLAENQIETVAGDIFDNLTKLQTLNLDRNPITNINFTWVTYNKNIKSLSLRSSQIQNISREFRHAYFLEYLDLSNNKITQIGIKSFRRAANLSTLILLNNNIKYIHPKAFKGLTSLKYLDLSDNRIENIYDGTFEYMPVDQLSVELWENNIVCDCHLAWLYEWKVKLSEIGAFPEIRFTCASPLRNYGKKFGETKKDKLSLKANDLTCSKETKPGRSSTTTTTTTTMSCPSSCHCFISKESYLLYNNPRKPREVAFPLMICNGKNFTKIPKSTDQNLGGLIMETNQLTTVDLNKLAQFQYLTIVNLQDNNIKDLPAVKEIILENVQVLSLENNKISKITKSFLKSFPMLRKLRMYNNQIKSIYDGVFTHNTYLTKLFLGPNPFLSNFTGKFLQNLSLINLGLRGTNLRQIPSTIKNKENLLYLDLSDNYITEIAEDAFTNCSMLKNVFLQNNQIKEVHEYAFKDMFNLAAVDLSENLLTYLPSLVFEHTGADFFQIDLWQNPFICDCKMAGFYHWIVYMTMKHGDSTEIRYMCSQPSRMSGITSTHTTVSDYVCLPNKTGDTTAAYHDQQITINPIQSGYSKSQLILAVSITIIICTCAYVCIQLFWKYARKSNYRPGIFMQQQFKPLPNSSQRDSYCDNILESDSL